MEGGRFEIEGMIGSNRLTFDVPEPWALLRVTARGADITDQTIDYVHGDLDDVEVVFIPRATRVTCNVFDAQGRSAADQWVLVFADDPTKLTHPSRYMRVLKTDAQGAAKFVGLPPALYRAVPLDRATRSITRELVESVRGRATAFSIAFGESISVRLDLK